MKTETAPSGVLVNGEWLPSEASTGVRDKFTNEVYAEVGLASPDQVRQAVDSACQAALTPLPGYERARILLATASILEGRAKGIHEAYVAETGFTRADASGEFGRMLHTLRLCAGEATRIAGEEVPIRDSPGSENRLAFTIRVPVGVVGAIAPFNAPLNTVMHKIGPALAAGNAVVLKPADQTPLCSIALVQAFLDAGLPAGLLNLVCGPGRSTGAALVADPRVRFFTFTGSTAVGLKIKQQSGVAKTHLELGANSATIVAADADLDSVTEFVARAGYRKAGQVCTSVQRLLVDEAVADDLWDRLRMRVESMSAGNPRHEETIVGPVISMEDARRAGEWVRESSGRSIVGGEVEGSVVTPALVQAPRQDSRLMRDEIFAPVVALVPVASLDEAISMVNNGDYGLQAGVFTADLDRAFDAARRLHVGGVIINDTSSYHADSMPYGGVKQSGYGLEGPKYAVEDMTDPRIIVLNLKQSTLTPTGGSR